MLNIASRGMVVALELSFGLGISELSEAPISDIALNDLWHTRGSNVALRVSGYGCRS